MRPYRKSTLLFRLSLLGGAVILLVLSYATLLVPVGASAHASVRQSPPSLQCPDPPFAKAGEPSLIFCSPINQGFVGGSYGTHIVLAGENLPSGPITWFYSQKNMVPDADTLKACLNSSNCPLKSLKGPTHQSSQSRSFFGWTWNAAASFPHTLGDYYIFAIIKSKNVVPVVSSVAFSLLSLQAPCAVISNNASSDCLPSQQLRLPSSTLTRTLTLQGSHWLLQGPSRQGPPGKNGVSVGAQVGITLVCAHSPTVPCNRMQLTQSTKTSDAAGNFTQPISLPANLVGTYDLCVASEAQTVTTPITSIQNSDTVVNNSLTYGCTQYGDSPGIIITIAKPIQAPSPYSVLTIIGDVSDGLSFLALLPIIAGMLFYFLYARKILFAYPSTNKAPLGSAQGDHQQGISTRSTQSPLHKDRR